MFSKKILQLEKLVDLDQRNLIASKHNESVQRTIREALLEAKNNQAFKLNKNDSSSQILPDLGIINRSVSVIPFQGSMLYPPMASGAQNVRYGSQPDLRDSRISNTPNPNLYQVGKQNMDIYPQSRRTFFSNTDD